MVEENVANKPDDMLNTYTIARDTFKVIFIEAAPILAGLRESHANSKARAKFNAINDRLRDFNRLCYYPTDWIMDLPAENASGPAVEGNGQQTSEVPPPSIPTGDKPGDRRCTRRDGYVREDGINKKKSKDLLR